MTSTPAPSQRSPILEDAWIRFSTYDKNAVTAQKRFIFQRKLILGLAVAAAFLAVTYSIAEAHPEQVFTFLARPWLPAQVNDFTRNYFLRIFHSLVVLVPIISTVLTAYTLQFNMGINWVMLRSSAEALKKEIYLYRMQVGEYSPTQAQSESRDMRLARRLKSISKRLLETQVNQTGLAPHNPDKDKLPPKFGTADEDNGFSDLTPEQYIAWRVENQFNYYQKKSVRFGKELQQFQLLIIVLGGVGAALTAFGFDIWITISSALATAFASFLEFKRVETTVIACNMAAADLYDIRTWWRSLSDSARELQSNIETLVNSTESVIQSENAGWLQEMRDALAEIYGDEGEEEKSRQQPIEAVEPIEQPAAKSTQPPPAYQERSLDAPQSDQLPEIPLESQPLDSPESDQPDASGHSEEHVEDPKKEEPSVQSVQPV